MRLAILTLILGILLGFACRTSVVDHLQPYVTALTVKTVTQTPIALPIDQWPKRTHDPESTPDPERGFRALTKAYRDAALVVVANISSDERNIIVDPIETWKAAPGFATRRILVPKSKQSEKPQSTPMGKALVCFYLQTYITHWSAAPIQQERVIAAPQYTLSELRLTLADSLNWPNQSVQQTPGSVTPRAIE